MLTENKCPHCGKPVPTTALGGICPECMIRAGVAETGEVDPEGKAIDSPAQPAPTIPELAPHFPQLEILECLGRGGMGVVYKARQPKLDRFVALKILSRKREGGPSDAEFAERFQREARALARLNHPDIIAVYDFGEAGGFHYLLMEYVDGLTLRQLLQTKKLSPQEALTIVPKICEALQFAHERGIVHRDIKPENILLDKQGRVKIADFGIAKIIQPLAPSLSPSNGERVAVGRVRGESLTGAKDVLGTPHYMAPEQIEKPATVDHRADIFSLGVVFYEMLTGELPLGKFQPPSRKVLVDVRLDEVVLHALEKEPDRRYQHASEVKSDVETIAATADSRRRLETDGPAGNDAVNPSPAGRTWSCLGFRLVEERSGKPTILWLGVFITWAVCFSVVGLVLPLAWSVAGRHLSPILSLPHALAFGWGGSVVLIFGVVIAGLTHSRPGNKPHLPEGSTSTAIKAARWTARVFSLLLLAFYGFFVLAEGLPPIATQPEGVQLNFVALGLMLAGFAVGWKREGTAALLIASGWTLWQVSEGSIRWNLFQTPLPVALLYGYCWWAAKGRRTGRVIWAALVLVVAFGLGRVFLPVNVFVRGNITDAWTGQPLANSELRLLPRTARALENRDPPNARSDQNGGFRLYVGWYSTHQEMAVAAPGYTTFRVKLDPLSPGQRQVNRNFALQPARPPALAPAAEFAQVPPVVVATVPESGAANVDAALTELRVTFSKPMQDGGWSWTKWGEENLPEFVGQPRYLADQRTCVVPVKLQPGRLYALWLNSEQNQNFTDQEGRAALPYLLIFETRK